MLGLLPNEIVLKIFKKTHFNSNAECRLLNSRYNQLIKKYELHKGDLFRISIKNSRHAKGIHHKAEYTIHVAYATQESRSFDNLERSASVCLRKRISIEKVLITLSSMLEKVNCVHTCEFREVKFSHRMIDFLQKSKSFKKIKVLQLTKCNMRSERHFFKLLNSLRLDDFYVCGGQITVPDTFINNVERTYVYDMLPVHCTTVSFDDKTIQDWLKPERKLHLAYWTDFTLGSVMNHIKGLVDNPNWNNYVQWYFGIMETTNSTEVLTALADWNVSVHLQDASTNRDYCVITKINDKDVFIALGCWKQQAL